jgi:hypothetical protein
MEHEVAKQRGNERFGRILVNEMPGFGYYSQTGSRYSPCQFAAALERDPIVLLTPDDPHRAAHFSVPRLDLVGISLIHLRDLPVESSLSR